MNDQLLLHKEIFHKEKIQYTINVYKDIVDASIYDEDNEYYIVRFYNFSYDPNRTVQEFENYLIGVENS